MQLFKETRIPFLKYKYLAIAFSWTVIAAGLVNIFFFRGLKLGVDFSGGTLIRVKFQEPLPISEVRSRLSEVRLGESKIQEVGSEDREYIIRTTLSKAQMLEQQEAGVEATEIMANRVIDTLLTEPDRRATQAGLQDISSLDEKSLAHILEPLLLEHAPAEARKIMDFRVERGIIRSWDELQGLGLGQDTLARLQERCYLSSLSVLSKETVGPIAGDYLWNRARLAIIYALLGILIYMAVRFKLAYGVSALLTLFHDVLLTLSIFSFTSREINLPVIAAFLTLVGYSINDTIVIFDRIRDNLKILRKAEFEDLMNLSINQTLSRTIITGGTTILSLVVLVLFGGQVINDFAFTLLIGIFIGTYSSIFQSCPFLFFWWKIFKPKKGMRK
ncbi:MAG: protein-export membrane protein SecF [Candidatus Aminicenantes bacterium RBG_13_62_12]|nr:MAG: protein-export membrane protein SecF [Candidatus Aminicenantes bacterium RBG_13_62_12]